MIELLFWLIIVQSIYILTFSDTITSGFRDFNILLLGIMIWTYGYLVGIYQTMIIGIICGVLGLGLIIKRIWF